MAPTVCSEKKVLVAGMKEARRRGSMGVAQASAATASSAASGATQNSVMLSYVAKGSVNSAGQQRRRRLPPRLAHILKRVVSTSSPAVGAQMERASKRADQMERMELDGLSNETSTQILRIHSSSNNIKTVLQPTAANNNSSNSNNKTTTAKFCDHVSDMEDGLEQDAEGDQSDGDSGFELAIEPIKLPHNHQTQQQQYHTHNEGLLSIAIKTITLVQRNKLLQKRLAQLQLETSEFIASVLANPENRHFRDKITAKTEAANKVSNVLLRH